MYAKSYPQAPAKPAGSRSIYMAGHGPEGNTIPPKADESKTLAEIIMSNGNIESAMDTVWREEEIENSHEYLEAATKDEVDSLNLDGSQETPPSPTDEVEEVEQAEEEVEEVSSGESNSRREVSASARSGRGTKKRN